MARRPAADALNRPPMPGAPGPAPDPAAVDSPESPSPARATKRYTIDLDLDRWAWMRRWGFDAELDKSALIMALIDRVRSDVALRQAVEEAAADIARRPKQ
jgi:hypothetical protein